jgi:hypothetical protein
MDNIFAKKSHVENIHVFKGVRPGKTLDDLMKLVRTNTPTKSLIIDEYLSSSLDINSAMSFMKEGKGNILIQIETSRCPYIYLPWRIDEIGNLKNENSINSKNVYARKSEFEILLPRGIVVEYVGRDHLMNMQKKFKNWHNYETRKNNKSKVYVYKFKITGIQAKTIEGIHYYRGSDVSFTPDDLKMFSVNKSNIIIVHKKERRRVSKRRVTSKRRGTTRKRVEATKKKESN